MLDSLSPDAALPVRMFFRERLSARANRMTHTGDVRAIGINGQSSRALCILASYVDYHNGSQFHQVLI